MAGADSTTYRGFYDTPHIQDRLRMYAQAGELFSYFALRQVNPLSILTVISEKLGKAPGGSFTDWRYRYQEFDELAYSFTTLAASARPVTETLIDYQKVSNNFAAGLNTNHRLSTNTTFTKATVAAHTDVSTTWSTTYYLPEILRILGIGEASSAYEGNAAASGYTWIKVQRCHAVAAAVTGQLPAIPITTILTIVNSVAKTNQRPNPPVAANGSYLENAVQITRESYGIGEHLTQGGGIKTYLMENGEAQLDLNFTLNETRLMKTIERGIVMGKKYMAETGNESEYESGGILEFIPSANYINAGGVLNVQKVNNIVSSALDISGVRELYMFGGSTYTKNLASVYENKRGFGENTELSVKYGLRVSEITGTGRDGIIYYSNAPILSELGMDNQALILNLTEYNYGEKGKYGCFQIGEKVPMRDDPDDAESYEKNSGFKGTWRELYYAWTLVRRLASTHFRVYGVTS
jgi:hypothetical protein